MKSALVVLFSLIVLSVSNAYAVSSEVKSNTTSVDTHIQAVRQSSHGFATFVAQLKQEAIAKGYSQAIVNEAFSNIKLIPQVIVAKKGQLEKKTTEQEYLKRVLPKDKVALAKQKYHDYLQKVIPIAQHYHVSARYIIALWGLESDFGRLQGHYDIMSALISLIYKNQRTHIFKAELFACLDILQKGYATRMDLKGSWAGAMGQVQFLPSSFILYGQDWDKNGKIDIWHNLDDVFASTANFLAKKGWNNKVGWGQPVTFSKPIAPALEGTAEGKAKTLQQWVALGVKLSQKVSASTHLQDKAWLIIPSGMKNSGYLVSNNFRILLDWNNSYDFALSVSYLAQDLK